MKRYLLLTIFSGLLSGSLLAQPCTLSVNVNPIIYQQGLNYFISSTTNASTTPLSSYISITPGQTYYNVDSMPYTFPGPGNYLVCYYQNTSATCYDSTCTMVTINTCPNINLNANPQSGAGQYSFFAAFGSVTGALQYLEWDMGDGTTASGYNMFSRNHTYANPGTYQVTVKAYRYIGSNVCVITDTITVVNTGLPPCNLVAGLSTTPVSWLGHVIEGTTNQSGVYSEIHIVPGNSFLNTDSVFYTFPGPGTYQITYYADQGNNCFDTVSKTILIANNCFLNSGIVSGSGNNFTLFSNLYFNGYHNYLWNFGDGTSGVGPDTINHLFPGPGIYMVTIQAFGVGGAQYTVCGAYDTIYVVIPSSGNCQAGFTLWQDTLTPTVYFGYNTSSTSGPTSYLWDFGDGNYSTSPNPSHLYATTGVYTVCLTVADSTGCVDTYCDSVGVNRSANGVSSITILPSANSISEKDEDKFRLSVIPNPVTQRSALHIESAISGSAVYRIWSVTGRQITEQRISLKQGQQAEPIHVEELSPGVYLLQLVTESGDSKLIRFVK